MVVAVTAVPPEWTPLVRSMLQSMSDKEGTLDLDLTLAQGQMRLGGLTLGQAPKLRIP